MSGCLTLMLGVGSPSVRISNQAIFDTAVGTATAGYRLTSSGLARRRNGATYTTLETWLLSGLASAYEARATVQSGTLTNGITGTWLSLSSDREWSCVDTSPGDGPVEASLLIEIRAASGATLDSATVSLTATSDV